VNLFEYINYQGDEHISVNKCVFHDQIDSLKRNNILYLPKSQLELLRFQKYVSSFIIKKIKTNKIFQFDESF